MEKRQLKHLRTCVCVSIVFFCYLYTHTHTFLSATPVYVASHIDSWGAETCSSYWTFTFKLLYNIYDLHKKCHQIGATWLCYSIIPNFEMIKLRQFNCVFSLCLENLRLSKSTLISPSMFVVMIVLALTKHTNNMRYSEHIFIANYSHHWLIDHTYVSRLSPLRTANISSVLPSYHKNPIIIYQSNKK
jgi:hypothetical protein